MPSKKVLEIGYYENPSKVGWLGWIAEPTNTRYLFIDTNKNFHTYERGDDGELHRKESEPVETFLLKALDSFAKWRAAHDVLPPGEVSPPVEHAKPPMPPLGFCEEVIGHGGEGRPVFCMEKTMIGSRYCRKHFESQPEDDERCTAILPGAETRCPRYAMRGAETCFFHTPAGEHKRIHPEENVRVVVKRNDGGMECINPPAPEHPVLEMEREDADDKFRCVIDGCDKASVIGSDFCNDHGGEPGKFSGSAKDAT